MGRWKLSFLTQRVQSCEVLLIPAEGQDLSHVDGWDPESGAVVGYINVIVKQYYGW